MKTFIVLSVASDKDIFNQIRKLISEAPNCKYQLEGELNYQKGLEKVRENGYDAYLIDCQQSEKNGISFIKEAFSSGALGPFILLADDELAKIDTEALGECPVDFLEKDSLDPRILQRSIGNALRNSRVLHRLKQEEKKYRNLFEKSIDSIFIMDEELVFKDVNKSMIGMLQYSKEELLKLNLKDIFKLNKDFETFEEKLFKKKAVRRFETTILQKDKSIVSCLISATPLPGEDGEFPDGYQGVIHDITERKIAEEELFQAERFYMTGKIARGIAHEIRNPLTNINLAIEQLKEELEGEEDAEIYFDIISRNSERVSQLITQIFNVSKPSELKLVQRDIHDIIEGALTLALDRINLQEIKIEKKFDKEICPISIDPDKLNNAILNIIVNAIESMQDKKGILTISTEQNDEFCKISIRDNGVGIEEEKLKSLFDPFYTGKKGGIGLGLTSTHNIIKSHGGKIDVKSQPGKGTCFTVFLKKATISKSEIPHESF